MTLPYPNTIIIFPTCTTFMVAQTVAAICESYYCSTLSQTESCGNLHVMIMYMHCQHKYKII